MDNEQERNEHFKGFAELLLEDLKECGAIPTFLNAYYAEQARTLIAQRAYDLMREACINISNAQKSSHLIQGQVCLHPNAMLRAIEDLTEWPKMASE